MRRSEFSLAEPLFPAFPDGPLNLRVSHVEKLLAGQTGTGGVLLGDPCEGGRNGLDGCPQFSGAQQSSLHEEGRSRFLLSQRERKTDRGRRPRGPEGLS